MAGGSEDPWSCLVFVLPTQSFLSWGWRGWQAWVIWTKAGRNGWSVLDSWSISMWHNFPVWAMSIACLVRPLSYIFFIFSGIPCLPIFGMPSQILPITALGYLTGRAKYGQVGVSQKRSSKMWLRGLDNMSLRRCSSSRNSTRGLDRPINLDGITTLTLKCLKCHSGKSARHFFHSIL